MRVLGIIPARYGSTRFPGKPLIDLKGKTMIQRVVEGVEKSTLLTDVIVATDDERIESHLKMLGKKVVMTSSSHPSGTDRCAEVVSKLNEQYDVVINIQGDEPLVDARQLDQLITAFEDDKVEIATIASKSISLEDLNNPNRIKVVLNTANDALYFSRSAIPNTVNAKTNPLDEYPFMPHIAFDAYRAGTLLKIGKLVPTKLDKI